jgi:predicted Rossmann-fold nucleotide-binding protein
MFSVCVYAGSTVGARPEYADAARRLGRLIVERSCRLVYGGGAIGLMGVIADEVLAGGGQVTGVIPDFLA